jgi:hypothetical protein
MTDDAWIVCARVAADNALDQLVPGSIITTCEKCQHPVWLAPSSRIQIEKLDQWYRILCVPCALPKITPDDEIVLFPGVAEELDDLP